MKNYTGMGKSITYTNGGSAISAGAVVIIAGLVGIAAVDIPTGASGTVDIQGAFTVPCASASVIAQGATLTWDASAGNFVATNSPASGDNVGGVVALSAAPNGVTEVEVLLLPGQGATS